ncbi:hypothetical protein BTM22_20060 [Vibrio parahaemolyticus]|nr:hypothetical protein BTM22_20060 [Vibrio parahaemolyticus]
MNAIKTALFVTVMVMTSASAFAQPLFTGGNYVSREEMKTISVSGKSTFLKFYIFHIMKLFALIWSSIFFCEEDLDSLQKHSVL